MLDRIRREPALVTGLVSAVIALGAAFGLDLSGEQTGAIMAVTAAVLAVVTRQSVTPNADVQAVTDDSSPTGVAAGPAAEAPTGEPVQVQRILGKA